MSYPQNMADISAVFGDCKFDPGQVYVILFQKTFNSGTKNKVSIADDIATWSALLAATDETKITATKKLRRGNVEGGEVIEFGGGNLTPEGVPIPNGKKPYKFTAEMNNPKQEPIKDLKDLENFASGLGVYFVTFNNKIFGLKDGADIIPIPIIELTILKDYPKDPKIGFYLSENWSDKLDCVVCVGIRDISRF